MATSGAVPEFRIYYGNGAVWWGSTVESWQNAPADDVQVVVVLEPPPTPRPDRFATGYVECSRLKPGATFYTGVDEYDPLGFGVKRGRLLPDDDYRLIWQRAYGDV